LWNRRRVAIAFVAGGLIGSLFMLTMVQLLSKPSLNPLYSTATVVRVIDGDTIELASGERVRYLGIDTPETFGTEECGGVEATALNRELVEGKKVTLLQGPEDEDRFGRLLRYVFVDGTFVNAELVWQGWARPQSFHPDEQFRQVLVQLGVHAETTHSGGWAECNW